MNPWTYKKTQHKTWSGKAVYEVYLLGEFMGWRVRQSKKEVEQLRQLTGYDGVSQYRKIEFEDIKWSVMQQESLVTK